MNMRSYTHIIIYIYIHISLCTFMDTNYYICTYDYVHLYPQIILYICIRMSCMRASCSFTYTYHAVHLYEHIITYIYVYTSSRTFIYTYHFVHLYTPIIMYTHTTYIARNLVFRGHISKISKSFFDISERYRKTSEVYYTNVSRCIGYLKLQVSFRKRATNYRALMRKMTNKDKAPYVSSPPCTCVPPLC